MKRSTTTDRWRVAIHEAAHAVVLHHLGLGTADSASIVPAGESLGRISQRNHPHSRESARKHLVMLAAGRAAENVVTGTRRFIDWTDFHKAVAIIERYGLDQGDLLTAHTHAEMLCAGPLFAHVGAFASILYDVVEMDRDMVFEMLDGVPIDFGGMGGAS